MVVNFYPFIENDDILEFRKELIGGIYASTFYVLWNNHTNAKRTRW